MPASTNLENFIIANDEALTPSKLNQLIQNFIDNDNFVYERFKDLPGVWECLWYNNSKLSGYSRGTFFWVNTEPLLEFMDNESEKLQSYAEANPYIDKKLPHWKNNDKEIFEQYYNVLSGYQKNMASHLQPVFYIGNLSAPTQLIVSQKNENKDDPSTLSSWKRFMIEDEDFDNIIKDTYSGVSKVMETHKLNYHFSDKPATDEDWNNLSIYADENFLNVEIETPNYVKNGNRSIGFDYVQNFFRRPYPNRTLSGMTMENQWFRLWRSGYLEHGGIIAVKNYLGVYGNVIHINFDWDLLGDQSKLYEIKYIGEGEDAVEIDESRDNPPGDNLLSVLYELTAEDFKVNDSTKAPVFVNTDYMVNVYPFYPNANLPTGMEQVPSYENIGDNSTMSANVPSNNIILSEISPSYFEFTYDPENTPTFYSYYVAGYTV